MSESYLDLERWVAPMLAPADRAKLYSPGLTHAEAALFDGLSDAPRSGRSAQEIVDLVDGAPITPASIRVVIRIYLSAGLVEPCGLAHFLPRGRKRARFRLTDKGRKLARIYVAAYRRALRAAEGEKGAA